MSIQNEITRLTTARNTLRTKAVALGIGLSTDDLSALATKYDGITDRGTPQAEVKEGETYTINPGYYHGGTVSGVPGGGSYNLQEKTTTPTKNEQTVTADSGYYGLSSVKVNPIPDAYQDVTSVTATAGDVLATKTIVSSSGAVVPGTMVNNGAISRTLDTETTSTVIPTGYHNGSGTVAITLEQKTATPSTATQNITPTSGKVLSQVTVNPIPSNYGNATGKTATSGDILYGETAIGYDNDPDSPTYQQAITLTGTMADNGSVSQALDCGESYTIPAGYHDGTGTVSANSLASQTGVDTGKTAITSATVLADYQGWVNGTKVSGTMANRGAVALTMDGTTTTSVTIPAGYHNGSGTVSLDNTIENALSAI